MIVESTPLLPPQPEPSGSAGSDRRPDGAGDNAFDRALTDVLTTDRAERSADRTHRRPEPADRRGSRAADRRLDRVDEEDDNRPRADQPTAADDRAQPNQKTDPGRTGPTSQHDDTNAPRNERSTTGTDQAAERVAAHLEDGHGSQHGLTTALARLEGGTAAEPVETEAVEADAVEAVEADTVADVTPSTIEPVAGEPSTIDQVIAAEITTDEADVTVEGGVDPSTATAADPADDAQLHTGPNAELDTDTESSVDEESEPTMDQRPGGQTIAALARDHRGAGLGQIIAEVLDATGAERPTESRASTNASPVAAVATGAGGHRTDSVLADEAISEEPISDGDATEAEGSNAEPSSLAGDDAVGVAADGGATADATSENIPTPQSTNPLAPAPNRSGDSATASASTATTPTPPPELVELHTTGLAERLRPAFAAVRRGVNGLDELRLRIQDENSGPIKVDITTVDNRVRVMLSAGNDDLMRHLGQERERLAAELRRAGFDQASIDIASEHGGERRNRYADDDATSGRFRPRGSGSGGATSHDEVTATSAHRGQPGSGLDLDL